MILLAIVTVYSFPLLAQFDVPSFGMLIADTVMLGIAYFPRTIIAIFLNVLPAALIYFLPSVLACMLFIWVPIGFSLTAMLIEYCLEPVFTALQEKE